MIQDPDWILIEKYYKGDLSAFHEIFSKYKAVVINFAFRIVRQRELAEDIAQDVFIKVYEKKARPDDKAKFSTWLYRVTANASLDHVRKKSFSFFSEISVFDTIASDKEVSPRKGLRKKKPKRFFKKKQNVCLRNFEFH